LNLGFHYFASLKVATLFGSDPMWKSTSMMFY